MADLVTIRSPHTGEEKTVEQGSVPFFANQGFEVLTADGKRNTRATDAALSPTPKKRAYKARAVKATPVPAVVSGTTDVAESGTDNSKER